MNQRKQILELLESGPKTAQRLARALEVDVIDVYQWLVSLEANHCVRVNTIRAANGSDGINEWESL